MGRKLLPQLVFAAISAAAIAMPGVAWGQATCPAEAVSGSVSSGCALAVNGATASGNGVAIGQSEPAVEATPPSAGVQPILGGIGTAASVAPAPPSAPALGGVATAAPLRVVPPPEATGPPVVAIPPTATGPAIPVPAAPVAPAVQVPQATGAVGSQPASSGALVRTGGAPGGLLGVAVLALVGGVALVVLSQRRQQATRPAIT